MIIDRIKATLPLATLSAAIAMLTGAGAAHAAAPPIKEVLSSHFGAEVDTATKGNVCTVESKHACRPGTPSSIPGGFEGPEGVAVAPDGDIYVADRGNNRVQELTSSGAFVLMFGREVNETTGGNVCTEEEIENTGVKCKAGVEGSAAGAFASAQSVAVDQSTGNVYVQDLINWRVDEYTATGQFVLTFGKEVNETTKGNICTAASGNVCKAGVRETIGGGEHGAFNFAQGAGDLLAVSQEGLVYVGDEHRVQEFNAEGEYESEISLTSISSESGSKVVAIAGDKSGDLYLAYRVDFVADVVREFNAEGKEVKSFEVLPREAEGTVSIKGMALDPQGHLAVMEEEAGGGGLFGSLYSAGTGHLITEFTVPGGSEGIAFDGAGELFAVLPNSAEVIAYAPVLVAELLPSPATCTAGAEHETDATFDCSLNGTVNPEGVSETEALFEWGRTCALGALTAKQPVATGNAPVTVTGTITGLRPNEAFCYSLTGFDENVRSPERLTSEKESFTTPAVAPKIVGEPSVSFVSASSAVMFGELNPENAQTESFFEYGPGETLAKCPGVKEAACPGVASTATFESAVYHSAGETFEASGLQPDTTYHYRLAAENKGGKAPPAEGATTFTTAPAPTVQASTGSVSAVTPTSAVVSGAVSGDGQPATYTFELGVFEGAGTQYGIVFSGPVAAQSAPVEETLSLTGLLPGVSYAYRIVVQSGYGTAEGAPVTFTTAGLPAVLFAPAPLAQLAIPAIAFPTVAAATKTKAVAPKKAKKKSKKSKARKGKAHSSSKSNAGLHAVRRRGKGAHGDRR